MVRAAVLTPAVAVNDNATIPASQVAVQGDVGNHDTPCQTICIVIVSVLQPLNLFLAVAAAIQQTTCYAHSIVNTQFVRFVRLPRLHRTDIRSW